MFYAKGSIISNLLLYNNYVSESSMGLLCDINIIELSTKVCLWGDGPITAITWPEVLLLFYGVQTVCLVSSYNAAYENYHEI